MAGLVLPPASPAHHLHLLQVLACVFVPIRNKTPLAKTACRRATLPGWQPLLPGPLRPDRASCCPQAPGPPALPGHWPRSKSRGPWLRVSLSPQVALTRNLWLELSVGGRERRESPLQSNISATTSAEDLSICSLVSSKHRRATCCCLASSPSISSP